MFYSSFLIPEFFRNIWWKFSLGLNSFLEKIWNNETETETISVDAFSQEVYEQFECFKIHSKIHIYAPTNHAIAIYLYATRLNFSSKFLKLNWTELGYLLVNVLVTVFLVLLLFIPWSTKIPSLLFWMYLQHSECIFCHKICDKSAKMNLIIFLSKIKTPEYLSTKCLGYQN